MPIYNGTQKVKPSGIAKVYVGTQLVYQSISVVSIALSGQTTTFNVGDTFAFGGTVTATYSNGSTANVTNSTTFSGYNMSVAGTYTVTASYTFNGTTVTASYSITVTNPMPDLYYNFEYKLNTSTKGFDPVTWTKPTSWNDRVYANHIWGDGTNLRANYYNGYNSSLKQSFNINVDTLTITDNNTSANLNGDYMWIPYNNTNNIYNSGGVNSNSTFYSYNKSSNNWSTLNIGQSSYQTYGIDMIYDVYSNTNWYINGSTAYKWNGDTSWSSSNYGPSSISSKSASYFWSIPGSTTMYYSNGTTQYAKTSTSWTTKTWSGVTSFSASDVFYYNNNTYLVQGSVGSKVLYKLSGSTWAQSNDIDLSYFNTNSLQFYVSYLWTPSDLNHPQVQLNRRHTTYRKLD